MQRYTISNQRNRGMAIVVVLGMVLAGLGIIVGLFKLSHRLAQDSLNMSSKIQSELKADYFSERIRLAIARFVQIKMAETSSGAAVNLDGPTVRAALLGQNCGNSCPFQILRAQNEDIIEIQCLGQGLEPDGVCDSSETLPKVYEFTSQTRDEETGGIAVHQVEIQIQQARLNSYSYFIKNETAPTVTIAPNIFSGIYAINFAPAVSSGGSTPTKRLAFRPADSQITFQDVVLTNLTNPQSQIENNSAGRVLLQKGIVANADAVSFHDLNNLHVALIDRARADFPDATQGATPVCSKVTLTNSSQIIYQEFTDSECATPLQGAAQFEPQSNGSFYARGSRVLLDANDAQRKIRSNNFALVADGNVELRSSIVRDTSLPQLEGYPTVMTRGDLMIPKEMKSLLPLNPELQNISSNINSSTPTIQVDLSYISIGQNASEENPIQTLGGSFKVDAHLTNAANSSQAINLGEAVINGMIISERSAVTRTVFGSGSSAKTDGFGRVKWNFPPALSALNTDWFQSQLQGGAVVSIVTRYERRLQDVQQALSAFGETESN